MSVRIGFDVSAVRHGLSNGIAVYTASLAAALLRLPERPRLTAYFCARPTPASEAVLRDLESLGAEIVRGPGPWAWSPDGAWWLPGGPPLRSLLERVDVFHVGEFHLPGATSTPCVATVYDLTTLTHPEHHVLLNRLLHRRRLRWLRRRADGIIAISHSTARDLEARLGVGGERVSVVHLARGHETDVAGPEAAEIRGRYGLSRPYILSVGTMEPRKNHERLVRAFAGIRDPGVDLALVGGEGWRAAEIRRAIDASPARSRIHVLGRVPARDLPGLYAEAVVFAYPSLYEGFGLPVLEAMAAGTPVLTSAVSSLPEVAADAAVLIDPASVDAIRDGLDRLLADPELRAELSRRGRERERAFTWRRAAEQTLDVYYGVCRTS